MEGITFVESGAEKAEQRPGLMTFPLWWHTIHCCAITLAHYGLQPPYERLKLIYDKHTFPGTELPEYEDFPNQCFCPVKNICPLYKHWLEKNVYCTSDSKMEMDFDDNDFEPIIEYNESEDEIQSLIKQIGLKNSQNL
eukprot:CAMPEP_0171465368 /NCGR_PEP_ID=MMETSP0945-20130129/8452_1 /TAXON_ID=109269 /ORGANISM="Vaucheria litorea, Strain CCMP2940" /LENGTH=137 /DNA_ID=CAMNT_0011992917 /DNA_START=54 /DNA_END=464 /DNA_ORIENTATION=+